MATDDSLMQGYAALLSAAELVPFDCPSPFGPGDRYQLDELAAITNKSWVYRATDQSFLADGKAPRVAIKISRSPGTPLEGFLGRRVEHPGVVRVLEQGRTPDGHGYTVMEWVDGGDLSGTDLPWPARDAAQFVARLARIVQAAHRVLVVHCDLKPSNILLTQERGPRLADFDLAQRVSDDSDQRKGTLAYMAPEQFRGGPGSQSVQADVYALGGTLHVLLKSVPPHGDDEQAIRAALKSGAWPACEGVEPSLRAIMRKALAPDLEERYATAESLAADLDRWAAHQPIEWQRPGPLKRLRLWSRRRPATAVALCAVTAAMAAGGAARWEWVRREARREAEVAVRAEKKAQQKFDDTSENIRKAIVSLGRKLTTEQRNKMNNEELLASLSIMDWMNFQGPNREENAKLSLNEYGTGVWNEVLKRCQSRTGNAPDTMVLFAHINLARLAIDVGDNKTAAGHLDAAEREWGTLLRPTDTTAVAIKIARAVLAKRDPKTPAGTIDVAALEKEAVAAGIGESLLRHLRPSPKPADGKKP